MSAAGSTSLTLRAYCSDFSLCTPPQKGPDQSWSNVSFRRSALESCFTTVLQCHAILAPRHSQSRIVKRMRRTFFGPVVTICRPRLARTTSHSSAPQDSGRSSLSAGTSIF
jgi:hypothetical protein